MSSIEISKTYSNNPFVDYLLYYTKLLAFGAVIKNEEEANKNETKESILNGDILISCFENTAVFELFSYDKAILNSVGITGSYQVSKCLEDKTYIPDLHDMIILTPATDAETKEETGGYFNEVSYAFGEYFTVETVGGGISFRNYKVTKLDDGRVVGIYALRDELTEKAKEKFIENYNEINNYYRKLAGLPNIGDYGIPIMDYEYIDIASSTIEEFINDEHATYVHELSASQIEYLDEKGILDQIKTDYPNADYLDYIANSYDGNSDTDDSTYLARKIYKARKAYNFQLLYVPDVEDDNIVTNKFKTKYEENRLFIMNTFYNDIFKETSDYYDNFIGMMIMILTMTDVLSEVHDNIIKKDLLDKRCIQCIFEMYGMPYYNTIPLKYQYRLCKNINQLIMYKSSSYGMLNIIDLFGAPNIEVFKYFILRDRKVDKWGDIVYNEIETKTSNLNDTIFHERVKKEWERTYTLTVKNGIAYLNGSDGSISKVIISDIASDLNTHINTSIEDVSLENSSTVYKITTDSNDNAYVIQEEVTSSTTDTTSSTASIENRYKLIVNENNNIEIEYYDINTNLFYNESDNRWYTIENGRLIETDIQTYKTKEIINDLSPVEWDYSLHLSDDSLSVVITFTRKGANNTTFDIPYPSYNGTALNGSESGLIMYLVTPEGPEVNRILDSYTISNDKKQVTINTPGVVQKDVAFDFYYNKESIEPYTDTTNGYKISIETATVSDSNIIKFNKLPYSTYFIDGNQPLLIVDGDILVNSTDYTKYTIDLNNNRIVLSSASKSNIATIVYIYNNNNVVKVNENIVNMYQTNDDGTTTIFNSINLTLPFDKYFDRGNKIIVASSSLSANSVNILSEDSYTITDSTVTFNTKLVNITNETIMKVIYIYSENSIYNNINIYEDSEIITATENFQTSFKLTPPFNNYFKLGYKAYPKLRSNKEYLNSDLYDIFNNTLTIKDQAIGLQKDQTITITYVYSNSTSNILCTKQRLNVDSDNQSIFTGVNIPSDYPTNCGIIVDITGKYIQATDYNIDADAKTFTIINNSKLPTTSDCINITFIRNNSTDESLRINRTRINVKKDISVYSVELPFKLYAKTNQTALVFHNYTSNYSSLVTDFSISDDNTITINSDKFKDGETIDVIFIYNNKYLIELSNLITEKIVKIKTEDYINNNLQIEVPYPFENYESNGWLMFITNGDGLLYDENFNNYDIVNGYFAFLDAKNLISYSEVEFHFIYFNNERYVYSSYIEDYDNDIDLKFVGVSIDDTYFNKNIIKKSNIITYDETTLADSFWDGVSQDDDIEKVHNQVKEQILAKKFNYERSKYYGINYVVDIANMSFKIAYFYNIFFDDVFKENKLTVTIPSIVPYKKINLAYVFTYLNALAYLYSGVDDTIIDTTGKILYIKGFNFKADIPKLKQWILSQRRYPNNFDTTYIYENRPSDEDITLALPTDRTKKIWDFDIKSGDKNVFKTLTELVNMFKTGKKYDNKTTNRDIYNFIVNSIYNSQDYDIFKIWKTIYDSLMTYKQSFDYYHITVNGKEQIASSLSEFLKYKETELYNDYISLKYISDEEQRKEAIVDRIYDVVYILEEYIDIGEFQNIFDYLPGVSGDAFLDMLFTIINFFKSYKIVLRSKGDYIIFNAKDPLLNALRFEDVKDNFIVMNKNDYITPFDSINRDVQLFTHYNSNIGFNEFINFDRTIESTINKKYLDYAKENNLPYTNTIKVKVDASKNQTIFIVTSSGETYSTNFFNGTITTRDKTTMEENLVTYFYSYKKDRSIQTYGSFTLDNDSVLNSIRFILFDNNLSGYLLQDKDDEEITEFSKSLDEAPPTYVEFTLKYGEEFYAYIIADDSYTHGTLNMRSGVAEDKDIHVYATDAVAICRFIQVVVPEHAHIVITNGDKVYTDSSCEIIDGSRISIETYCDEGYIAGNLIIDNENIDSLKYELVVKDDAIISVENPVPKKITVDIKSPDKTTIKMVVNNETMIVEMNQTKSFSLDYNSQYFITILVHDDYSVGELNIAKSGIIDESIMDSTDHVTITCSNPSLKYYTVYFNETENQQIIATYNYEDYTEDFSVPIHSKVTVRVEADAGYSAGRPIQTSYVVEDDIELITTDATVKTYNVTITSSEHQTIYFTNEDVTTEVKAGETISLEDIYYGSKYSISVTADDGYNPGNINITPSGVIDENITTDGVGRNIAITVSEAVAI